VVTSAKQSGVKCINQARSGASRCQQRRSGRAQTVREGDRQVDGEVCVQAGGENRAGGASDTFDTVRIRLACPGQAYGAVVRWAGRYKVACGRL